jgi:hypothetical protein
LFAAAVLIAAIVVGLGALVTIMTAPTSTTSGTSLTTATSTRSWSTTSGIPQGTTIPSLSKIDKIGILKETAQKLNPKDLSKEYCIEHPSEELCSHVPEFHHYHIEPVPEAPSTFSPEPCNMLCVVSYSDTDVELKNNGQDPITVLVVTVSWQIGSADSTPVSLKVMPPGQAVPLPPLQYANGSHVGLILYYN